MLIPDSFRWLGIKPRNGIFAWVWTFLCFTVRFLVFLGRALFLKGLQTSPQLTEQLYTRAISGWKFEKENLKRRVQNVREITTGENPELRRTFIFHPNWILGVHLMRRLPCTLSFAAWSRHEDDEDGILGDAWEVCGSSKSIGSIRWYIDLHLVDFYGKCRQIYHTWILWERKPEPKGSAETSRTGRTFFWAKARFNTIRCPGAPTKEWVSTAHEQFKKLRMWPEAVECLIIAERNVEAEDMLKDAQWNSGFLDLNCMLYIYIYCYCFSHI